MRICPVGTLSEILNGTGTEQKETEAEVAKLQLLQHLEPELGSWLAVWHAALEAGTAGTKRHWQCWQMTQHRCENWWWRAKHSSVTAHHRGCEEEY